jgi:hypothetical protein
MCLALKINVSNNSAIDMLKVIEKRVEIRDKELIDRS